MPFVPLEQYKAAQAELSPTTPPAIPTPAVPSQGIKTPTIAPTFNQGVSEFNPTEIKLIKGLNKNYPDMSTPDIRERVMKFREDRKIELPPEPAKTKGQEFLTEAEAQFEEISELEGAEKAKATAKAIIKGVGGVSQRFFEKAAEGFGDFGAMVGLQYSGVNLTREQRYEILRDMDDADETPEGKEKIEKWGKVLNTAAAFAVPAGAIGAAPKGASLLARAVAGAKIGAAGTTAFKVQTEGELPSIGEVALGAGLGGAIPIAGAGISKVATKLQRAVKPTVLQKAAKADKKIVDFAEDVLEPKRTKKQFIEAIKKTGTAEGKASLSAGKEATAKAVQELNGIKTGSFVPRKHAKNIKVIRDAIGEEGNKLQTTLKAEGGIFPDKQLQSVINDVKTKHADDIFLTGDNKKAVDRVYKKLDEILAGKKKTIGELLESRKEFDRFIESQNINPFESNQSKALHGAIKDLRRGMNHFMADNAKTVPVRESLKLQAQYFDAIEDIATKLNQNAPKDAKALAWKLLKGAAIPSSILAGQALFD